MRTRGRGAICRDGGAVAALANSPACVDGGSSTAFGTAGVKDSLTIISKEPVRFFHQQAQFGLVTRRADVTNDPAPARDRLSDLHRRGPRGRANPPNPGHQPSIPTRISALTAH